MVAATTSGSAPPAAQAEPVHSLIFVPRPAENSAVQSSAPSFNARPSEVATPRAPSPIAIPDFAITPATLPSIDARMEDVFESPNARTSVRALSTSEREGAATSGSGIIAFADKPALARADNPVPRYPEELRRSGARGLVRVRFVIDVNGTVRLSSVTILSATHPLFADAVREVLPGLRFMPAEAGDRAVAVLVEQTFDFTMTP